MNVLFLLILAPYFIVVLLLLWGARSIMGGQKKHFPDGEPETEFSVIVPFRNEEKCLAPLLGSIAALHYPVRKFEILFVDDSSEDNSVAILRIFQNQNPQLSMKILSAERKTSSPKKDALTSGINQASYPWVITTDADCEIPVNWLRAFDIHIQQHEPKMVCGPVSLQPVPPSRMSTIFDILDFLALQGTSMGAFCLGKPFMCNGANLAFAKAEFQNLNGYSGNDHIASGDDVFLLQKFAASDSRAVRFLVNREAIVTTMASGGWSELIRQRVRWAAKTTAYKSGFAKVLGILVLVANFLLACSPLLWFLDYLDTFTLVGIWLLKVLVDAVFIAWMAKYFKKERLLVHLVWAVFFYPFFTVYVAFLAFTGSYRWKGREFGK